MDGSILHGSSLVHGPVERPPARRQVKGLSLIDRNAAKTYCGLVLGYPARSFRSRITDFAYKRSEIRAFAAAGSFAVNLLPYFGFDVNGMTELRQDCI